MTQSLAAQIEAFSQKALRNADLVVKSAAQDIIEDMTERQPSARETGGSFEVGRVPVYDGVLIGSTVAELNGAPVSQGTVAGKSSVPADYVAALANFKIGDVISYGFSATYAPMVEYGTSRFPGRFFVREAVNGGGGWQGRIDQAAARFKD